MTEQEKAKYRDNVRRRNGYKHEGFGESHSITRWADLLGVPRNTMWRYLNAGLTVEEVAEIREITYLGEAAEDPTRASSGGRKPRTGHQIEKTRQLMLTILQQSGYDLTRQLDLEVTNASNRRHLIRYQGSFVGSYDYRQEVLTLSCGTPVPVGKMQPEDIRVVRGRGGLWEMTQRTAAAVVDACLPKLFE